MPAHWLVVLGWVCLAVAFGCAALIAGDIFARGYRQPMRVMEAEWPVTALYLGAGVTLAGEALFAEYVGDYLIAVLLGLVFQFFAIAPMRGLGLGEGIAAAAKVDLASLTAFEVGLFGWMALTAFVLFPSPHLHPDSPVYWFMMQIGMALGFVTAFPVNAWLISRGIKEAM